MPDLIPRYYETFTGRLVGDPSGSPSMLIVGRGKLPPRTKLIARGDLCVFFAFPLLMTRDYVFPQLVIDDFRREYHGKAAIEFLYHKGNSYPRGDAVGMRMSDGSRGDFYIKEVDIAAGLCAFACSPDRPDAPLGRIGAVVWLDASIPPADVIAGDRDTGDSLLRLAARCVRCNPIALAGLLAEPGRSARS